MITVAPGNNNTVTLAKLTSANADGIGVFDVLMRSVKAQLDAEYNANRIKGSEYATVYLGSLQAVLQTSLQMVLAQEKTNLEIQVLEKEVLLRDQQITRTNKEIEVLEQKRLTELAQVESTGVDADSIIGRQKALYLAQSEGFTRDAEHKAAQLLLGTWNVRRTTDSADADYDNHLNDVSIGAVVTKLCDGIGVTLPTAPIVP
jgi:hypothetical protein